MVARPSSLGGGVELNEAAAGACGLFGKLRPHLVELSGRSGHNGVHGPPELDRIPRYLVKLLASLHDHFVKASGRLGRDSPLARLQADEPIK